MLPRNTGDAYIGIGIAKLLAGNLITLVGDGAAEIASQAHALSQRLAGQTSWAVGHGYACAKLLEGRETTLRVRLSDGFYAAQDVLGFSLTELSQRDSNSVIANPAFKQPAKKKFDVFAVMPFAPEFNVVFEKAMMPAAEVCHLRIGRGDHFKGSSYIIDDIWSSIYNADYVVADCTGQNVNVFYELGISHTLGRDTLILTQNAADIPFDLRHWRHHVYDTSPTGIAELKGKIQEFLMK